MLTIATEIENVIEWINTASLEMDQNLKLTNECALLSHQNQNILN